MTATRAKLTQAQTIATQVEQDIRAAIIRLREIHLASFNATAAPTHEQIMEWTSEVIELLKR